MISELKALLVAEVDGKGSVAVSGTFGFRYDSTPQIFAGGVIIPAFEGSSTQSTDSGSCCPPIVSFATNSPGLYPWLGLNRNNLVPGSNIFHGWEGTAFTVDGDINNGARRLNGEIYEVIIIERVIDSIERQLLEGYLACKYDTRHTLDLGHPYYDLVGANKSGYP